jgi:hypothetical protein
MTQQIMLDHAEFVEAWHLATTINKYLSIYLAFFQISIRHVVNKNIIVKILKDEFHLYVFLFHLCFQMSTYNRDS